MSEERKEPKEMSDKELVGYCVGYEESFDGDGASVPRHACKGDVAVFQCGRNIQKKNYQERLCGTIEGVFTAYYFQ